MKLLGTLALVTCAFHVMPDGPGLNEWGAGVLFLLASMVWFGGEW